MDSTAAIRRISLHLTASAHWGPVAAVLLAAGLTLAILTEGSVPALWTKLLLMLSLPLNVATALWLTRNRSAES